MLTSIDSPQKNNLDWLIVGAEEYRNANFSVKDKVLPRPHISIVFHFKNCPSVFLNGEIRLESFFVVPILPNAVTLGFEGDMDTFVVNCKPTAFSKVFNLDLSKTTGRRIQLPQRLFFPLWNELKNLRNKNSRLGCFAKFVDSVAPTYYPDAVDQLYDKILEKGVEKHLKLLMNECNSSRSTLLRKFIRRAGVGPKTLTRVVRFNRLWMASKGMKKIDYQDMAFEGNYFDQAHFINDFKSITGETPRFFFNRNLEEVRLFSGEQI